MTEHTKIILDKPFCPALPRLGESKQSLPKELENPSNADLGVEEFQPVQGMLYAITMGIAGWLILLSAYHYSF